MLKNSEQRYGVIAMLFHWLSAVAIVCLFFIGLWMMDVGYEHHWYDLAVHYHESLGIILAIVIILRWVWRQLNTRPTYVSSLSSLEKRSATIVHHSLYFLCLVIFISGYLMPTADGRGIDVFTWFTVPALIDLKYQQVDIAGDVHIWLAYVLMVLACIHTLAALKHHFIDKDNTLNKICKLH